MSRYAQYSAPYVGHEMSMDVRHARAIGRFLRAIDGRAAVVEVGCCYGVSTAEILSACEERDFSCTLIDTAFQVPVGQMSIEAAGRVRLVMDAGHSAAVLAQYVHSSTVVILDGDHRQAYMEVESEILESRPPRAIVLHDIASDRPDCDGPAWFLHRWQARGRYVAVDYLRRQGERTHRGLAILTATEIDAFRARQACGEC